MYKCYVYHKERIRLRVFFLLLSLIFLLACSTQGKLEYITVKGEMKTACETEYSGSRSVDKYAVEYVLSYCARKAKQQGHTVINKSLLELDLSIPKAPEGNKWTFELATKFYESNQLSDKEYGYIIAYVDLVLHIPDK